MCVGIRSTFNLIISRSGVADSFTNINNSSVKIGIGTKLQSCVVPCGGHSIFHIKGKQVPVLPWVSAKILRYHSIAEDLLTMVTRNEDKHEPPVHTFKWSHTKLMRLPVHVGVVLKNDDEINYEMFFIMCEMDDNELVFLHSLKDGPEQGHKF